MPGATMATVELAIDAAAPRKPRKTARYFFLGMAALAVILLSLAFVPEFVKFGQGTFPIPWILHVHAAIMASWVAAFVFQAWLGATGRTALHRRVGPYSVAIGWLAWGSMIFVEFRALRVHPLPTDVRDYDWNLPGPYVYVTFAIFLAWAVHERRRPAWHKRLMTFALFLSLLAAIQRYLWIPIDYGYGPFAAMLDISLLAPLLGYDLYTLKGRLHPATIRGTMVFGASQALLFSLWGTEVWRHFAAFVAHAVHG
jgi:hypothetical protein